MEFENENIAAYRLWDGTIVCGTCVTDEEDASAQLNDFIFVSDIESGDTRYCCIRCENQITA